MAGRSLKVSLLGMEKAKRALLRNSLNKKALAVELGMARSTVSNFFSGKAVDRLNFEEICKRLSLEWQEIVDMPPSKPETEEIQHTISKNPDFVGREEAITDLNNLVNQGGKVILIQAEGGVGKTTLAQKWFEHQGLKPPQLLELSVGKTPQDIQLVEDWVRLKLQDYFKETPEQNFCTMLEQLKSKLQTQKVGVLIDNLELALINNGEFIEQHHRYIDLLTVLANSSVQSITLITSREPLYDPAVMSLQTVKNYELEGLNLEAWEQYKVLRTYALYKRIIL